MYLLDSNVCIQFLRNRSGLVTKQFSTHPASILFVCAPVEGELRFGARNSRSPVSEMQKLEGFLAPYPKLPYDDAAAVEYADIRLDLTRRGQLISDLDMLIAAIARSRDLTLVTHNTAEFARVPGLNLADWELP